jgi:heptosyltransferase III
MSGASDFPYREGTAPRSVLIVVTRRIGDVLLATPLIRSLKQAWPQCAVDVLVFSGTEGIIAANRDVRRVLTIAPRPGWRRHLGLAARIARRYDIAFSLVPGDRPTLYAYLAGRWRAGLLVDSRKERWKQRLLDAFVPFDNLDTHTVRMNLALAPLVGVAPRAEVVAAWSPADARDVDAQLAAAGVMGPLAVLHTFPKFNYKMWHDSGWVECAQWIAARGLRIVLTGGPDAAERAHVARLAARLPAAVNFAGALTLPQTACLLARARVYVGPDTVVTHMASALGTPTVALFGPSNPVKWGPWPRAHSADRNPWDRIGSGTRGNVALVQGMGGCVPCLLEGCERHVASFSECLTKLPAARVIAACEALLRSAPASVHVTADKA